MTDDSEDEDYGKLGYNRVKLNFVDDPHPVFAGRPQPVASKKGKELDEKDKVHFAPFVDKYLSDVPECKMDNSSDDDSHIVAPVNP
jgi:hypothetical protein